LARYRFLVLPPAARDLLVAFYRLWFPATHPLAESRRPYPASLPDVLAQFGGEDYNDDLARLKSLLGNLGCAIPPLYKQYSEVCEPGGVQFIDFGSDPDFNNCVDGLVLVDLTYLKANRYQRYIGAHLLCRPDNGLPRHPARMADGRVVLQATLTAATTPGNTAYRRGSSPGA
jgi:hypothetical protein